MNSKAFFSKTLFVHNLRRYWWVSALYALLTFFAVPFQLLTRDWRRIPVPEDPEGWALTSWVSNEMHMFMVIVVAVLTGALLFRYLMENRQTSFYHAAPFGKRTLFVTQAVSALTLILVPVLLNALLVVIIRSALSIEAYFTLSSVAGWLGATLMVELVMLASVIFVGMFTGSSIAQVVFTGILHLLPAGLILLLDNWFSMLLHGYTDVLLGSSLTDNIIPVARFLRSYHGYTPLEVVGYCLLAAVLFAAAYFFYKKRPLERAGELIVFKAVKPIFLYGVTACMMLVGVNYIGSVTERAPAAWVYLLWGLFGYVVAAMLMRKSFKILDAWKGFVGFAVVMLAVLGVIRFDLTGFEQRVPEADEVEEVLISDNHGDVLFFYGESERLYMDPQWVLTEKEDLESLKALHETLAEDKETPEGAYYYIAYKLKNGRRLVRSYPFDYKRDRAVLEPMLTAEPHLESRFTILTLDQSKLEQVELESTYNYHKSAWLQGEDAVRVLDALCLDLKERTYEQLTATALGTVSLTFVYEDPYKEEVAYAKPSSSAVTAEMAQIIDLDDPENTKRSFSYGINNSYKHTMEVLRELGLYDSLYPGAESFDRLELYQEDYDTGERIGEMVIIWDKEAINAFMQNDGGYSETFMYGGYYEELVDTCWWANLYGTENEEPLRLRLGEESVLPPEVVAHFPPGMAEN